MLELFKKVVGDGVVELTFKGIFDVDAGLTLLRVTIPDGTREVRVNLQGIERINSQGVLQWLKYFGEIQAKGGKLRFRNCSSAITPTFGMLSSFSCGGLVESVMAPFQCPKCNAECELLVDTSKKDFGALGVWLKSQKCRQCQATLAFNDIAQQYFSFMLH